MLSMLVEEGYLDKAALDDEAANENEIIDALYRGLKGSPCKLMAASIVDAVGEKRTQNQPGTNNEYPNWRIPLADGEGNVVPLEKLFDEPRLQEDHRHHAWSNSSIGDSMGCPTGPTGCGHPCFSCCRMSRQAIY